MAFTSKDVGTPCPFCSAELVLNPKTGKVFCSARCWTKNNPSSQQTFPKKEPEFTSTAYHSLMSKLDIISDKLDRLASLIKGSPNNF